MKRYNTGVRDNPYVLMAILVVLWGLFSAISKLILGKMDSFQVQFYMFGVATVVWTIIICSSGRLKKLGELKRNDYVKLVLFALPSFFYYFMYTLALRMIPAVEASMLNYLFPIMIVLFAVPINREKINTAKLISICMGFAGMVIIITNGHISSFRFSNIYGDLLAIGAAVCWGIFSNLGKRNNIDQFVSNYFYTVVSFILSTINIFVFSSFALPGITAFAGVFWIGVSNIVLAYYLWFKILKATTSAMAASLSFITPFVTLAFIVLLLGESIGIIQIAGFLLILVGIGIQNKRESRHC